MKETARDIVATNRISLLRNKTILTERYLSIEQARIITRVYKENEDLPVNLKRSKALALSLKEITIHIEPEELIVGNRTSQIRGGVVFPEAGISWLSREIESLPEREQDPFNIKEEDIAYFREEIEPYWKGKTLEDEIYSNYGREIKAIEKVVKINQKDHAQGHICPDVQQWLEQGPSGLLGNARTKHRDAPSGDKDFYQAACNTLEAAINFMNRYATLADEMARTPKDIRIKENLLEISRICRKLAEQAPDTFHEAMQSVWFLFVILHMESNASSFSPGRMDQYLYPYFSRDIETGTIDRERALELIDALFIKFNQIVYMRNRYSAKYFAGFPIGFNVALGGQTRSGKDATNELSYLFLKAMEHIALPQPNLTARLHSGTPDSFYSECSRVIGLGNGMPQIVNDHSIIPALESAGINHDDAMDYAVVGCVELSSQGNYLGWSDAAMFNLVKALELTLNDGKCLINGEQLGLKAGDLTRYKCYEDFEDAFKKQIDHFLHRMLKACNIVEEAHQKHLPSAFLSSMVKDCLEKGLDVTAGGATYNFSGIQAIQVANIADNLAVLKKLVFDQKKINKQDLLDALRNNFQSMDALRQVCLKQVDNYGNDVAWVDELGGSWVRYFYGKIRQYKNYRGGDYLMGLYTVSAHVPMGQNVGATPDGRLSGMPLADGGLSPVYGRDKLGPTAVLRSVSRIPSRIAANGTLLNMKFFPSIFASETGREKFASLLKAFVKLPVHHVQFNVVNREDLLKAKKDPESYRGLTVRVAGYTAYFTELTEELQNEIIERTSYGITQ